MKPHHNKRSPRGNCAGSKEGFTFIEMLVVMAVLLVCGLMVLPATARTKNNSPAIQCLNNLKKLGLVWSLYSADNGGKLAASHPGLGCPGNQTAWALGNAGPGTSTSAGSYCYSTTNATGIQNGKFWPYVKDLSVYKCPADEREVISTNGARIPLSRSYSMNSYMNGVVFPASVENQFWRYTRESQVQKPSKVFVLIDEDPLSINDSMFIVDMAGSREFLDLPSRLHDMSYSSVFADGHTELTPLKHPLSSAWKAGSITSGNTDWQVITNRATEPK